MTAAVNPDEKIGLPFLFRLFGGRGGLVPLPVDDAEETVESVPFLLLPSSEGVYTGKLNFKAWDNFCGVL